MRLRAYQTPKQCTEWCLVLTQDLLQVWEVVMIVR